MAINSVSSGTSAYSALARQPAENQKSSQPGITDAAERRKTEQTRDRVEADKAQRTQEAALQRQREAAQPVKNAEGQTTGTRINVSA